MSCPIIAGMRHLHDEVSGEAGVTFFNETVPLADTPS